MTHLGFARRERYPTDEPTLFSRSLSSDDFGSLANMHSTDDDSDSDDTSTSFFSFDHTSGTVIRRPKYTAPGMRLRRRPKRRRGYSQEHFSDNDAIDQMIDSSADTSASQQIVQGKEQDDQSYHIEQSVKAARCLDRGFSTCNVAKVTKNVISRRRSFSPQYGCLDQSCPFSASCPFSTFAHPASSSVAPRSAPSPSFPTTTDQFDGAGLNGNALKQRNLFVYPPQSADTCDANNATLGEGMCGSNGNEKIFAAD